MNMKNTNNTKAAPTAIPMITSRDNIGLFETGGGIVLGGEVVAVLDGELVVDVEPAGKRIKNRTGRHTMWHNYV